MRFLATLLVVLIAVEPTHAQWGGGNAVVAMLNPQVLPANASAGLPAVDDNFAAGGNPVSNGVCAEYGHHVPCTNHYSISRASTKYCAGVDGIWTQVASGIGCLTNQGYLIEEARTNNALRARDMTQAAWTAVGTGAALNAVGIDGTTNSASTLTATGTASSCTASCTILQTLTLGSAADTYSVWLKRVTGTGTVNITINNLVGTTACTLVTTAFTRCSVTATLANPVIGIQMTVLNDVIIADVNQLEAGAFATSPIPTTTVSVTRAADTINSTGALASVWAGGIGSSLIQASQITNTSSGRFMRIGSSSLPMYMQAGNQISSLITANLQASPGSGSWGVGAKAALGFDGSSRSLVMNNGTVVTNANSFGAIGSVSIGSEGNGTNVIDGYLQRLSTWNSRLPDATLKAMTQ